MTGKELFDYHQSAALKCGFGSPEFQYGNILFEALKMEGEEIIFKKLEEADRSGKRIKLSYSTPPVHDDCIPDQVLLV